MITARAPPTPPEAEETSERYNGCTKYFCVQKWIWMENTYLSTGCTLAPGNSSLELYREMLWSLCTVLQLEAYPTKQNMRIHFKNWDLDDGL